MDSEVSSKVDARIVKTDEALRTALLGLLERKPLEQITIREIAAVAGIHYTTFFRHHATKEALLDHLAADQIDRLVALCMPVLDQLDSRAAFVAQCTYINDHRKLWSALLTGGAAGAMREELLRLSREVARERAPKEHWIPVELAVNCTVSLTFETLAWWLTQPAEAFSIEKVAEILNRLVVMLSMPL